jgi:hypothetical protein
LATVERDAGTGALAGKTEEAGAPAGDIVAPAALGNFTLVMNSLICA